MLFAQLGSGELEAATAVAGGYALLTIAVPIMIALILLLLFILTIGMIGTQERISEIGRILEDVFSDKLRAVDAENDKAEMERRAAKARAWAEAAGERKSRIKALLITVFIVTILTLMSIAVFAATRLG